MKTEMKTVALYSLYGSERTLVQSYQVDCNDEDYLENDPDWVRVSEPVEVVFALYPEEQTIGKKVDGINQRIEEKRAEMQMTISDLEEKRDKLLAITYEPAK